ncbi:uncharacterized protein J3D65DRAFT_209416 [Phyllosticta citribraziliensis]|uniref:Secreted protein n=1 Tax=Phyllosticta citribraziliensis TaxID=989973 RepID=A0ABR1M407_9PEZI
MSFVLWQSSERSRSKRLAPILVAVEFLSSCVLATRCLRDGLLAERPGTTRILGMASILCFQALRVFDEWAPEVALCPRSEKRRSTFLVHANGSNLACASMTRASASIFRIRWYQ